MSPLRPKRGLKAEIPTTAETGEVLLALDSGEWSYADVNGMVRSVTVDLANVTGKPAADQTFLIGSSGSFVLPAARTAQVYRVKVTTAATVVLSAAAGISIDGAPTLTLSGQNASAVLQFDGSNFWRF